MGMWNEFRAVRVGDPVTRSVLPRFEDARGWLTRHRLPLDDESVSLVADRLRARRRGWVFERVVVVVLVVVGWWLLARDQVWRGPDPTLWLAACVGMTVVGDVLRRWVVWSRWDRGARAALAVRMVSLNPPTWGDLVGMRAVRRAAVLLCAGVAVAVATFATSGATAGATAGLLVFAAAVHPAALLEVARRRPVAADSEEAIAINDRLRGEEADRAATLGLFWVVLVPVVDGGPDLTLSLVAFVWYLFVVSAVRHRYAYELVDGGLVAR